MELIAQINTHEFRAKNQTDQRAELDLLLRLFRDQVNKKMTGMMQNEFLLGAEGEGFRVGITS